MKRLIKSKLRKRIEFRIEMLNDSITAMTNEIKVRKIKQTLNPAEYSKIIIRIKDCEEDLEMLKSLL